LCLYTAVVTNDDVEQNDSRLFAFDPIGRIDEWSAAMLADPSHTSRFEQGTCHLDCGWASFTVEKDFARLQRANVTPAQARNNIAYRGSVCNYLFCDCRKMPQGFLSMPVKENGSYDSRPR
jgi:hypothetical protein